MRFGSELTWFKSSYSSEEGGECLEVAMDWHKSGHSAGDGGQCVEVRHPEPETVHIRDSKNISGPRLAVNATTWTAFVDFAAR